MFDIPKRALLFAAIPLLVLPQTPDTASASPPQVTVVCLAPGGAVPIACNSATRGSLLELKMGERSPALRRYLVFREIDAVGPPKVVRVAFAAARDTVRVAVPEQLCAYGDSRLWKLELRANVSERSSIGVLRMRC